MTRRVADAIFVHGNQQRDTMAFQGFPDNELRTIKLEDSSYFARWASEDATAEKSILFFGLIQYYKGITYLIEAAPKIITGIPDAKVLIAGKGDLSGYADAFADHEHYEVYNRFIPGEEVTGFFQGAALVVLPYVGASQSSIVPVAYAFKKPVVVTDVGSIPEAVENGKAGIIIPPKDADRLVGAVIGLLQDPQRLTQMGENAYNKVEDELSWDAIAREITLVYRDGQNHQWT